MDKFIEVIAEIFEVEPKEISFETDFRVEIEDWNSMMGFALIVMLEDEYHVVVSIDEFLKCRTVGDLYNKTQKC